MGVVFQNGGAEFVIVRVVAFEEDEAACGID